MQKPPKFTKRQLQLFGSLAFAGLLLIFGLYVARFIRFTSFEINGQHYYALFDDAMISMQYARNLAEGHGLVWNAGGERVEGFSNPLWVFYMAFWHLFSLPKWEVSLPIQISGAVFLFANLFVVKKLAEELMKGQLAPLLAVFLTAFYFHLNNWALQGMEVGALVLLLSSAAWLSLRNWRRKAFSPWPYILATIGTLVRVDVAVPLVVLASFWAWKDKSHRELHLKWGFGFLAGSLLAQTALRRWYYGEWLPNTYYLKVVGIPLADRLERGWTVFKDFVWGSGWFLMLLPLVLLLVWPQAPTRLLFALVLGQVAYSIYVGGDAWEHKGGANRFIAIAMPLFFVLFVQTLDRLRELLATLRKSGWTQWISQGLMAAMVLASLFSFNVINENDAVDKWMLLKRPIFVAGTQRYTTLGLLLNQITEPDASIAVVTAGNIIYFAERTGVDMLGKADREIARSAPHESGGSFDNVDDIFRPGHNKWDYQHSIVDLAPDIVAQIWGSSREMAPYLEAGGFEYFEVDGFPLYIRVGSSAIRWDEVNSRTQE